MFSEALGQVPSERTRVGEKGAALHSARSDLSGWDHGIQFARSKHEDDDDDDP